MDELPPLSVDLLDRLEEIHPPIAAQEYYQLDDIEFQRRVAQRELVETLRHVQKNAEEDDLDV